MQKCKNVIHGRGGRFKAFSQLSSGGNNSYFFPFSTVDQTDHLPQNGGHFSRFIRHKQLSVRVRLILKIFAHRISTAREKPGECPRDKESEHNGDQACPEQL